MTTQTEETPPWFPIETERLLLRPFREDDFDAVHAYATDPGTIRFMTWGPNTLEQTREVLGRWLTQTEIWPRAQLDFAVMIKATGALIGCVSLHHADTQNGALGYCYHSAHWRKGYGYEAARAVAGLAFRRLGHHRIWATCDTRNHGSYGIMEKLGMRREGLLRESAQRRDGWQDSYLYAILADEWAVYA